jgi:poly(hydroxyalkanoate) depolymerase family esterase
VHARLRTAVALLVLVLAPHAALGADGQFTRGTHEGRAYRLYLPPAGDAVRGAPTLVVALHGCFQTPEDFATGTRLNDAADRRGLVVLYPAQSRRDNVSRCWNWFDPARAEAAALLRLVDAVAREHATRPGVVVLGFSAGGYLAVDLACTAPDVVAAIGVMAGGPFRCGVGAGGALDCMRGVGLDGEKSAAACAAVMGSRARPIRASLWQGDGDSVVRPASLTSLAQMLAVLDHAPSVTAEPVAGATRTVHRGADGVAWIEAWLVPGMGHAWSGGDARGSHTFPHGPPATERMLDFLLEAAGPPDSPR